ncbi:tyrosine-type recombinase/integrase [Nitratireductor aquibiodomus]|uniref:tyrosine-type recombinase/integrase n=1 Tax=Nitratireductor aquibiodomus TaxID=204799 RepID=UPI0032B12699
MGIRADLQQNPARGIKPIYRKGDGAKPWKAADVRNFLKVHLPGSKAHVALSVLLWSGCRIEDLTVLGREHECRIEGIEALRWTPLKKGSTEVSFPLLAPLKDATRAMKVQGTTYVLGRGGKPFASGDSMSAMFKRWCKDAGLAHLSAHGVRKGLAELLAELGCSQYEIMAILGHSEAKTSEVYTRRVERWKLAKSAIERINVSNAWVRRGTLSHPSHRKSYSLEESLVRSRRLANRPQCLIFRAFGVPRRCFFVLCISMGYERGVPRSEPSFRPQKSHPVNNPTRWFGFLRSRPIEE